MYNRVSGESRCLEIRPQTLIQETMAGFDQDLMCKSLQMGLSGYSRGTDLIPMEMRKLGQAEFRRPFESFGSSRDSRILSNRAVMESGVPRYWRLQEL